MTDHRNMKLGKRHARKDARVPKLARYTASLPIAPAFDDNSAKLSPAIGMMGNDSLGNCTCAAIGHAIQVWTSQASSEITLADSDVIALYERFGYNPANPATDGGAFISDVLASLLTTPVAGHGIDAYAEVETSNLSEVRAAIYLFGGIDIGLNLPTAWQSMDVWDVPPSGMAGPGAPGSWGGHSVFVVGYDTNGVTLITWGERKRLTWAGFSAYCDEAYAILSPDWKGAEGFDYAALTADVAALKAGDSPPRAVLLTDKQLWMIGDAISSKVDGAGEDEGVVASVNADAVSKEWQSLQDYLNLPRAPR